MVSPWHWLPNVVPDDALEVWVRLYWYAPPFLARWGAAAQEFEHSSGLVLPWYHVWRWKHVAEPPP